MAVHGLVQPTYYLCKSALKSSVVLQAVAGHISSPTSEDIVFGKETAIELLVVGSDGTLQSVCEQSVFGTIKDLKLLPWNAALRAPNPQVHGKDVLAVLSDSGKLSFLTFSVEAHRFLAVTHVQVSAPGFSPRDLGRQLAVEPRGRAVAVAAFKDRLALFPASPAAGDNLVEKGIVYPRSPLAAVGEASSSGAPRGDGVSAGGTIWSTAFVAATSAPSASSTLPETPLPGPDQPPILLAVLLHRKGAAGSEVHILSCDPRERTVHLRARYLPSPGPLPTQLVPVPAIPGFLLLARTSDLMLLDVSHSSSPRAVSVVSLPMDGPPSQEALVGVSTAEDWLAGSLWRRGAEAVPSGRMNEEPLGTPDLSPSFPTGSSSSAGTSWETPQGSGFSSSSREGERSVGRNGKESLELLAEVVEAAGQGDSHGTALGRGHEVRASEAEAGTSSRSLGGRQEDQARAQRGSASSPLVVAWSWEADGQDADDPTLVIGTDAGALHRVYLRGGRPQGGGGAQRRLLEVGERCFQGAACSSLLSLGGGLLAALVEMGDGHVLQAQPDGRFVSRSRIQNIAPMTDFELADYDGEKQDQMLACCGAGAEGTLRVIRNGISVEQLLTSPPAFPGITATWPLRIRQSDPYHSLLVMSFLQESRVLSVGLSFNDITETVGFNSGASTIACGRVEDGWLAQVCAEEIRLCSPAIGPNASVPLVSSWTPPSVAEGGGIRVGAVAQGSVLVALSRVGTLLLLGTEPLRHGTRRLVALQQCRLPCELSCISIPQEEEPPQGQAALPAEGGRKEAAAEKAYAGGDSSSACQVPSPDRFAVSAAGLEVGKFCVVGTYQPSVELLSLVPGEGFRQLAAAPLVQASTAGLPRGGAIPESARVAQFDRLYVLVGLRNGMLLRFEWTPSPSPREPTHGTSRGAHHGRRNGVPASQARSGGQRSSSLDSMQIDGGDADEGPSAAEAAKPPPLRLHLAAVRRIGVSPVSLVPLKATLRSEIVALSDRPWLLQAAHHQQRVAYTPISFQASSHATALSTAECPLGLVFIADCCLHLVEMEPSKRLSVQRLPLGGTPRRLVFHAASKTLLLILCLPVAGPGESPRCEIRCMDPMGGTTHSSYRLDPGEVALSLQLWRPEGEELLVVGTGPAGVPPLSVMNGDPVRGRLLVFRLEPRQPPSRPPPTPTATMPPVMWAPAPALPPAGPSLWTPPAPPRGASSLRAPRALASVAGPEASGSGPSPPWPRGGPPLRKGSSAQGRGDSGGQMGEQPMREGEAGREGDSGGAVEGEAGWVLRLHSALNHLPGPVVCLCQYLGYLLLVGAGSTLLVFGLVRDEDGRQRLKRLSKASTRFAITSVAAHLARIAVGDCRDGVLLFSYREDTGKLEQLLSDPAQRLVADCTLIDPDTAIAVDKKGNLCSLTASACPEGSPTPERNLGVGCWFHVAESALRVRQGSLAYRAPLEDGGGDAYSGLPALRMTAQLNAAASLVAGTMLGSVLLFLRLTREEYELLAAVERRVAAFQLTAPLLGNDHARFRSRGAPRGVSRVLDGDMLEQFLELTSAQQQAVLVGRPGYAYDPTLGATMPSGSSRGWRHLVNGEGEEDEVAALPLETVLRLLEKVHHALS